MLFFCCSMWYKQTFVQGNRVWKKVMWYVCVPILWTVSISKYLLSILWSNKRYHRNFIKGRYQKCGRQIGECSVENTNLRDGDIFGWGWGGKSHFPSFTQIKTQNELHKYYSTLLIEAKTKSNEIEGVHTIHQIAVKMYSRMAYCPCKQHFIQNTKLHSY